MPEKITVCFYYEAILSYEFFCTLFQLLGFFLQCMLIGQEFFFHPKLWHALHLRYDLQKPLSESLLRSRICSKIIYTSRGPEPVLWVVQSRKKL